MSSICFKVPEVAAESFHEIKKFCDIILENKRIKLKQQKSLLSMHDNKNEKHERNNNCTNENSQAIDANSRSNLFKKDQYLLSIQNDPIFLQVLLYIHVFKTGEKGLGYYHELFFRDLPHNSYSFSQK